MKTLADYSMFDQFTARGLWWIPEEPEDKIAGEVSFSPKHIRLRLDRPFRRMIRTDFASVIGHDEVVRLPVILGSAASGEDCTLRTTLATKIGSECEFAAAELLIGAHVPEDASEQFGSAIVHYSHMEEWAYAPLYEGLFDKTASKRGYFFPVEAQDLVTIDGAPPFARLVFFAARQHHLRRTKFEVTMHSLLDAQFASPSSIRQVRSAIDLLSGLLTLLVGEAVCVKKLRLKSVSACSSTVEVFFRQRRQEPTLEFGHDMAIQLSDVRGYASLLIQKWLNEEARLRSVYNLLLGTIRNPDLYVQSVFLSLMQALESFHRIIFGGYYDLPASYDKVRRVLSDAIPAEASNDLRNKLRTSLEYGNHFSLRRRLNELIAKLSQDAKGLLLEEGNAEKFVSRLVDTRNYLTHYDEKSAPEVIELSNDTLRMLNLNKRLRGFMTALLFQYFGLPDQLASRFLSPSNLHLAQ